MTPEEKVAAFVRKELAACGEGDRVRTVELRNVKAGTTVGRKVEDWEPSDERDPKWLARECVREAVEDAEAFLTQQTYAVLAHRDSDPERRASRSKTFSVVPKRDEGADLESPDARGLVGQAQRHLEKVLEISTRGWETLERGFRDRVTADAEELARYRENERVLWDERRRVFDEALRVDRKAHDLDLGKSSVDDEIKKELLESLKKTLPLAGPTILGNLGKMVEAWSTNKKWRDAQTFFASMAGDEQANLLGLILGQLSPEQAETVAAHLTTRVEEARGALASPEPPTVLDVTTASAPADESAPEVLDVATASSPVAAREGPPQKKKRERKRDAKAKG